MPPNKDPQGRDSGEVAAIPRARTWLVKPRGRCWAVQRLGALQADSVHATKAAAIERGCDLAARAAGLLRIKDQSGRVVEERTFRDRA